MAAAGAGWPRSRGAAARDRTRRAILDTALRLFTEHGYVGVRVEDIAREAGVSRATFYKHFAERDEILGSLFEQLLGSARPPKSPPTGDAESRVTALLSDAADQMLDDEVLARFVYSLPVRHDAVRPGGAAVPSLFTEVRRALDQAADGELRRDASLDLAMDIFGRIFEAAMRDWAEGRVDDPRSRIGELVSMVFHGLLAG